MTVSEIQQRVEKIRDAAGDSEVAHGLEDDLHVDVLKAIADQDPHQPWVMNDIRQLATEALKTREIDFSRWYA